MSDTENFRHFFSPTHLRLFARHREFPIPIPISIHTPKIFSSLGLALKICVNLLTSGFFARFSLKISLFLNMANTLQSRAVVKTERLKD